MSYAPGVRVALVHDWLTGIRGGERVLHEIAEMFPEAELHTLVHAPGSTTPAIERLTIHTSPLDRLPGVHRHYRNLLPAYPWAVSQLRPKNVDLVISTHHAVAKGVRVEPGTPHLCYCFTPMRYIWDQIDAYLGQGKRRTLATPLVSALRRFDQKTSGPDRVTRFTAISTAVRERIHNHYGREADVVYPPVDTERIQPSGEAPEDFYLLVGGFVPYKREALAIEAFRALGRRLVVVGDGPSRAALEATAPANVEFTGRVSDAELADLYARCRALIYPQEEDFGIVAVEAQAAGRPVVAFAGGGALDTVIPLAEAPRDGSFAAEGATGVLFPEATVTALCEAVLGFEKAEPRFDAGRIRAWAEGFGRARFRRELQGQIETVLGSAAKR